MQLRTQPLHWQDKLDYWIILLISGDNLIYWRVLIKLRHSCICIWNRFPFTETDNYVWLIAINLKIKNVHMEDNFTTKQEIFSLFWEVDVNWNSILIQASDVPCTVVRVSFWDTSSSGHIPHDLPITREPLKLFTNYLTVIRWLRQSLRTCPFGHKRRIMFRFSSLSSHYHFFPTRLLYVRMTYWCQCNNKL